MKKSDIKLEDLEDMSVADMNRLTPEDYAELQRQRQDINRHALKDTNAQHLRDQIMEHSIHMIKRLQSQMYKENKPLTKDEYVAYDKLWPVVEGMIQQTSDLKRIEAKNASDVLEAVTTGKMTLKDAALMMALLKDQVTIEELPKLLDKLSEVENA